MVDSLPSPYDPILHGNRRLDPRSLSVQTDSHGSSDSNSREPLSVPALAAALWPASSSSSSSSSSTNSTHSGTPASSSGTVSLPGSPHPHRQMGSMSMSMDNGLDGIQDSKTSGPQSPSATYKLIDGADIANKFINKRHTQSFAGPTGYSGTPSSRKPSYANLPQPTVGDSVNSSSGASAGSPYLHRDSSHANLPPMPNAYAGGGSGVSNAPYGPSVEEVARSVIHQLVLGSPKVQELLGLSGGNTQGGGGVPQPSAITQAVPSSNSSTSATSPATLSGSSMPSYWSKAGSHTPDADPENGPPSLYSNANAFHPPAPHEKSSLVAPDGGVLPVGSEATVTGLPSSSGAAVADDRHAVTAPLASIEKRAEQLLDQHLLSSQKVPSYRLDEEIGVPVESGSLSSMYLTRLFGLHGQVAIVTGAARGIGLALARGLAMAGARVCMADMNFDQAARESAALNEELKQADATFPLCVDVTKRESIVNLFTSTVERYGTLSICVNNAGLAISGEDPKRNYSESFSEEDFDMTINLNLKAVFFCCQFAARWMIANSVQGSIINVASMSAKVVNWPQRQSVYNASKAAVVQLTKCLAVEWCSYGIRVNSISPGYIDTPLNRQISIAHLRHEWTKKTPQHRLGDPRDLVAAVIYLASARASAFTTGEDFVIDGGYTLW